MSSAVQGSLKRVWRASSTLEIVFASRAEGIVVKKQLRWKLDPLDDNLFSPSPRVELQIWIFINIYLSRLFFRMARRRRRPFSRF